VKKIIFVNLITLLTLNCSNIVSVDYLPAIPDESLTCCSDNDHSKVALFIRGTDPVIIDSKGCQNPARLYYKITEYRDGETIMEIVCKSGRDIQVLEKMGRLEE
jgi:hypothetical protein